MANATFPPESSTCKIIFIALCSNFIRIQKSCLNHQKEIHYVTPLGDSVSVLAVVLICVDNHSMYHMSHNHAITHVTFSQLRQSEHGHVLLPGNLWAHPVL